MSKPEYLKAEDLIKDGKWCEFTLTIKQVHEAGSMKNESGDLIQKPVIEFEAAKKMFVCGKTNERIAIYATGESDCSKWGGKQITIGVNKGKWTGKTANLAGEVTAIRLRLPPGIPGPTITKHAYGINITGEQVGPNGVAK